MFISGAVRRGDLPDTEQQQLVRDHLFGLPVSGRSDSNRDGLTDAADFIVFVPDDPATVTAQAVSFWYRSDPAQIEADEQDVPSIRGVSFWYQSDPAQFETDEEDVPAIRGVSFWYQTEAIDTITDENDVVQLGNPSFERQ